MQSSKLAKASAEKNPLDTPPKPAIGILNLDDGVTQVAAPYMSLRVILPRDKLL